MPKYTQHIMGLSDSPYFGERHTVSFLEGFNINDEIGIATPNNKFSESIKYGRGNDSELRGVVKEYANSSLFFFKNKEVIRYNGKGFITIGELFSHNGISLPGFNLIDDIDIDGDVFVALDAQSATLLFGNVNLDGVDSRVEIDTTPRTLPAGNYDGIAINQSYLFTIKDGKLLTQRLDTTGRPSGTTTETDIPDGDSNTTIRGIAATPKEVFALYSNNKMRAGSIGNNGAVTWGGSQLTITVSEGTVERIGAHENAILFGTSSSLILGQFANPAQGSVGGISYSSAYENGIVNTTYRGVGISGTTVMTTNLGSVFFGTITATSSSVAYDFNVESDFIEARQYGDYIYYATRNAIGRWEKGKDWDTREDAWNFFFNGDSEFHPMYQIGSTFYIGDAGVVATIRDDGFIRKRLDISGEWRIRVLSQIQTSLLIGTQNAYGIDDESLIFIWDTVNDTWTSSASIPEKSVTAFIPIGSGNLVATGEEGRLYGFDGYSSQFIKKIPSFKEGEILPSNIIRRHGLTLFAVNRRIYSVFQNGQSLIFNIEHEDISTGTNYIRALTTFGGEVGVATDTTFRLEGDGYTDASFTTRVISVNNAKSLKPAKFYLEFLEPLGETRIAVKQIVTGSSVPLNVLGGFGRNKKIYECSKIQEDIAFRFVVTIAGVKKYKLVSFNLEY